MFSPFSDGKTSRVILIDDLDIFFNCGGFGEIVENRTELVKNALIASKKYYNRNFDNKNVFLFGDTEKDIKSAIDNDINPVLIDNKQIYLFGNNEFPAKYYGIFENINLFLDFITKNNTDESFDFSKKIEFKLC